MGEQFTTEAATFTLLGLIVGLVVGAAGSTANSALVSHSGASSATGGAGLPSPFLSRLTDINAQAGWGVILDALAAAIIIAALASAATTWMIGRIQPAEGLRSE